VSGARRADLAAKGAHRRRVDRPSQARGPRNSMCLISMTTRAATPEETNVATNRIMHSRNVRGGRFVRAA